MSPEFLWGWGPSWALRHCFRRCQELFYSSHSQVLIKAYLLKPEVVLSGLGHGLGKGHLRGHCSGNNFLPWSLESWVDFGVLCCEIMHLPPSVLTLAFVLYLFPFQTHGPEISWRLNFFQSQTIFFYSPALAPIIPKSFFRLQFPLSSEDKCLVTVSI